MAEIAVSESNQVKIIDLHSDPQIPQDCRKLPPIHIKSKRPRCNPAKIELLSKDKILGSSLREVISYFQGDAMADKCVANSNARDFYVGNPDTIPGHWNGRIIFPGTFFTRDSNESSLVVAYITVSNGKLIDTGEVSIFYPFTEDDFFAYFSC